MKMRDSTLTAHCFVSCYKTLNAPQNVYRENIQISAQIALVCAGCTKMYNEWKGSTKKVCTNSICRSECNTYFFFPTNKNQGDICKSVKN